MSLLDKKRELIGRGQYGLVYSGRYNHRSVALKEFQALGQQSDAVLRQIKREAAIMTLLIHKNIISFEGFSLHSGLIAMGSLFNILHNKKKFADIASITTLSNLALCTDIANGMCYLHFRHIQHRDLKSANVLIFRDYRENKRFWHRFRNGVGQHRHGGNQCGRWDSG
jgi:serine/threonine protein kinase